LSEGAEKAEDQEPAGLPIEEIPDCDLIARLVLFPRMYDQARGLIWPNTFEFPDSQGESVAWNKYIDFPEGVHRLGCAAEERKRAYRPDCRYVGYIPAEVKVIRDLKNARGHGFSVAHEPSEGIHHAEIRYRENAGGEVPIRKGDKAELKALLRDAFGSLVPHSCV